MIRALTITLLIVAVSSPASGRSPGATARRRRAAEREVKKLDRAWGAAVVRRDAAALDRLLAEDYTQLNPSGETINKAQEIANTKTPIFVSTVESLRTEDVEVKVSGERATVTGFIVVSVRLDGQGIRERLRYTRTYAKRDGRWQIVAAQLTMAGAGR
ncbi:MAG: nuclear transport factor 2 family protein [Pyrinomonadaceae bacterium]